MLGSAPTIAAEQRGYSYNMEQGPAGRDLVSQSCSGDVGSGTEEEASSSPGKAASAHLQHDGAAISRVVTGREFAIFLTASGELMKCGATPKQVSDEQLRLGQLKRGRNRAHTVGLPFKRLSVRERATHTGHSCHSLCHPATLHLPNRYRVWQIACGVSHCVVLCGDGDTKRLGMGLFSWGNGAYGQLGLGEKQQATTMTRVETSPNLDMLLETCDPRNMTLQCGAFSTYVLVRNTPTLWHWGLLPSPDPEVPFVCQGVPVQFPLLDESVFLVDVAVGIEHLVLLSVDGRVFTWGHGGSGQLGLGLATSSNVDQPSPTQVHFFHSGTKHSITAVACGWNHSVAVSKDGQVFAWGSNAFGACGASSKFCAYFQPVLVALPSPLSLGLSSGDVRAEAHCSGDTSIFSLVRCADGEDSVVERAFMSGITSSTTATLLPTEVPGIRGSTGITKLCYPGLGVLVCVFLSIVSDDIQNKPPITVWAVQDITVRPATQQPKQDHLTQELTRGMIRYRMTTSDHISIQLQAVTMGMVAQGQETTAEDGVIDTSAFQLTQEIHRAKREAKRSVNSDNDGDKPSLLQILSVRRRRHSLYDAEVALDLTLPIQVEIVLVAQIEGRGTISLTGSDIQIVGGAFMVDIASSSQEHNNEAPTTTDCSWGNDKEKLHAATRVLGARVEDMSVLNQPPAESNWYRLSSNRFRVWTDDAVSILLELSMSQNDSTIFVESKLGQLQSSPELHAIPIHIITGGNQPRGVSLGVAQVHFTSSGSYSVYMTHSRSKDAAEERSPLLSVDCCVNANRREQVLSKHHSLIRAKLEKAQQTPPSASRAAQFSLFTSAILQSMVLREVVALSPWLTTSDTELAVLPYDFDRERNAHARLLQESENPFVLWTQSASSCCRDCAKNHRSDTPPELGLTLNSILPSWATNANATLAIRLEAWLKKSRSARHGTLRPEDTDTTSHSVKQVSADQTEVQDRVAAIGFTVQQKPSEFLGGISSAQERTVHQILAADAVTEIDVHDSIAAWHRTNGDLFYTTEAKEKKVRRYGHESHDFPETAQNCGITWLKGALSDFLWKFAENVKVEELFLALAAPLDESTTIISNDAANNVIHLHQLAVRTEAMGFEQAAAMTKQEWFALFRGIQTLSLPSITGITFSVFRTFLMDPFHQFFWRQYMHKVYAAATSINVVSHALLENFAVLRLDDGCDSAFPGVVTSSEQSAEILTAWPEFISSLRCFHATLELSPMSPSDCCRLLYRFDIRGNAQVSVNLFQQSVLLSVRDLEATDKRKKSHKHASKPATQKKLSKQTGKMKVAIDNDHRRPNVEVFTSRDAVRKLFAARSKPSTTAHGPAFSSIEGTSEDRRCAAGSGGDAVAALRASGNSRLARIRSLPVSHLLRQGTYFRPPRQATYQVKEGENDTQAQVLGAEDSY